MGSFSGWFHIIYGDALPIASCHFGYVLVDDQASHELLPMSRAARSAFGPSTISE
jgi:hypothetical protein